MECNKKLVLILDRKLFEKSFVFSLKNKILKISLFLNTIKCVLFTFIFENFGKFWNIKIFKNFFL